MEKTIKKGEQVKIRMLQIGREEGFTLLEILIVIAIVATFITLNLPHFATLLDSIENKAQLRSLEHLITKSRELSIRQQQATEIRINNNGISYLGNNETIKYSFQISNYSNDKVIFYPDGTSTGGSFDLLIQDKYNYRIIVDKISGRVKFFEL